jgi:hypothetical protein
VHSASYEHKQRAARQDAAVSEVVSLPPLPVAPHADVKAALQAAAAAAAGGAKKPPVKK